MCTSPHHLDGLEQLISIDELSEYLGVPVKTIYDCRLTGAGSDFRPVPWRRCIPTLRG
jgi:hypothetical protein